MVSLLRWCFQSEEHKYNELCFLSLCLQIEPVSSARFYMNWDSGKLYLLYALDQEGDSGVRCFVSAL